ncbi:unnamed protein product [Owenia fusiformis]|uniref:Uncharacterized protein n=1 Tax=Owenia fusiformis TaxID=6347 RepID=A0A8S4PWL0_OWEFU|nr:unnamed protein product [Owenia fusiformis]
MQNGTLRHSEQIFRYQPVNYIQDLLTSPIPSPKLVYIIKYCFVREIPEISENMNCFIKSTSTYKFPSLTQKVQCACSLARITKSARLHVHDIIKMAASMKSFLKVDKHAEYSETSIVA